MSQKRSFRNVKLTEAHHFQYLGLWVIISAGVMFAANIVLFLWLQEHFTGLNSVTSELHTSFIELKNYLLLGLAVEYFIFLTGMVALAKLTAHRIAGPYIQLQKTFDAIRNGDRNARLKFRNYDQLEYVSDSFNAMMDSLNQPRRDA